MISCISILFYFFLIFFFFFEKYIKGAKYKFPANVTAYTDPVEGSAAIKSALKCRITAPISFFLLIFFIFILFFF